MPGMPPLVIAPEGTLSHGRCLLSFKTGAFAPGRPVVPILFRYKVCACLGLDWIGKEGRVEGIDEEERKLRECSRSACLPLLSSSCAPPPPPKKTATHTHTQQLDGHNPGWGVIRPKWHLFRLLTQLYNHVAVEVLPVYTPSAEEVCACARGDGRAAAAAVCVRVWM